MLTEAQRKRVLYHLDYALLSLPTTLGLGLPIVTQARFIVEQNMLFLDPSAEPFVHEVVGRLDCIIREMDQARGGLMIERTGDTVFRAEALPMLKIEYKDWVMRLADMLGAQSNPVSNRNAAGMGGVVEGC
jgi:hypothetical protein